MIAIPAEAVPRSRFFAVLEANGCTVTDLGRGMVRIGRDQGEEHFREIWPLDDAEFIYPFNVERIARLLHIPLAAFADPDA